MRPEVANRMAFHLALIALSGEIPYQEMPRPRGFHLCDQEPQYCSQDLHFPFLIRHPSAVGLWTATFTLLSMGFPALPELLAARLHRQWDPL